MNSNRKKNWWRIKVGIVCVFAAYVTSYFGLTCAGRYYSVEDLTGKYEVWGAYGCQKQGKHKGLDTIWLNELGMMYLPLSFIDRKLWHKTQQTYSVQGDGQYFD